jgi:hypothetical protein
MRVFALVPMFLLLAAACDQAKAPTAQPPATKAASLSAASQIAKVVFIDKEQACDCTRKRIDGSWTALQAALGEPATLPVERIHVDTQAAQARPYTVFKPLMVPPGIYFVDAREAVVELLQGEVTTEQIAAILKRK